MAELYGRAADTAAIAALLDRARAGESGWLVLRGEPGIGKTALLDHAADLGGDLRVLRGAGVEIEAELPFAGLQLLLRPAVAHLPALPVRQRAALEAALRLGDDPGGDAMLVGLAVLSLLTEYAGDTGLVCLIDDAQWLDRASLDTILFAARRLYAEGIVIILAARDGAAFARAADLPERRIARLDPDAAAALLDRRALPAGVRRQVLAEAQGNPLALLELADATRDEGRGAAHPGALALTDRLQLAFHGQISRMPKSTQDVLLIVAAEESGELSAVLRAAAAVGAGIDDLAPAEEAGLLVRGQTAETIAFRHPLIRAAVYQRAPLGQRVAAHRALAAALDGPADADRRAWHAAAAATGPDAEVAAALEDTAARALARSGHEAAAAAYERAARLTAEPGLRAHREALAAQSALTAGDLERAAGLARRAAGRSGATTELRARVAHVEGLAHFWQGRFAEADALLRDGAAQVADRDPTLAATMLVQALHTGWYLGEHHVRDCVAQLTAVPLADTDPLHPVVTYMASVLDRRDTAGAPPELTRTLEESERRGPVPDQVRLMLCGVAMASGQDAAVYGPADALTREYRSAGAAGRLPTTLFFAAEVEIFTGRLRDARTTAAEALRLAEDLGQRQWVSQLSSVLAHIHAAEGDEQRCRQYAETGLADSTPGSVSPGAAWAHWSLGLLELGAGRAESALSRFERLTRDPLRHHLCAMRSIPDLVEAAVRVGAADRAEPHAGRLADWATAVRQPWAEALVLRCRALLSDDDRAEGHYTRALDLHDREARPVEYARTAQLYGEWLRRARRKSEARTVLAEALDLFERIGMRPWAERARTELVATGAAPGGTGAPSDSRAPAVPGLTPQELQIARLAAQGLSNRDIAAQLFLSHRTVGYHLYKAYPKLGVTSRGELKTIADQLF
ncbi:AAA family ATPase [Nocardia africana]|uniref:AAA family ATPase n=1 Tax=Nocardia africana TaxID=134964 RepID=A0ABW6NR14_9NOCA